METINNLEELKAILSSHLENYLNGIIDEWKDWVKDMGGSRVKSYQDIIDWLYDDTMEDTQLYDNINFTDNEIMAVIKNIVENNYHEDFENRKDLKIYVIRVQGCIMIKIIYEGYNYGDLIELYYDTKTKKYIFIINGDKKVFKNLKGIIKQGV